MAEEAGGGGRADRIGGNGVQFAKFRLKERNEDKSD